MTDNLLAKVPDPQLAQVVCILVGSTPAAGNSLAIPVERALSSVSGCSTTGIRDRVRLEGSLSAATRSILRERSQRELRSERLSLQTVLDGIDDLVLKNVGPRTATFRLKSLLSGTTPAGGSMVVELVLGHSKAYAREPAIVGSLSRRLSLQPKVIRDRVRSKGWRMAVQDLCGSSSPSQGVIR